MLGLGTLKIAEFESVTVSVDTLSNRTPASTQVR